MKNTRTSRPPRAMRPTTHTFFASSYERNDGAAGPAFFGNTSSVCFMSGVRTPAAQYTEQLLKEKLLLLLLLLLHLFDGG